MSNQSNTDEILKDFSSELTEAISSARKNRRKTLWNIVSLISTGITVTVLWSIYSQHHNTFSFGKKKELESIKAAIETSFNVCLLLIIVFCTLSFIKYFLLRRQFIEDNERKAKLLERLVTQVRQDRDHATHVGELKEDSFSIEYRLLEAESVLDSFHRISRVRQEHY